jgi:hypothetical protein
MQTIAATVDVVDEVGEVFQVALIVLVGGTEITME